MNVYFRKNSAGYECSVDEFDDDLDGEIQAFELPDFYTDSEAEEVCDLALERLETDGVEIEKTLTVETEKKQRLMDELLEATVFQSKNPVLKSVRVSVYLVNRGNFNDERLVESVVIPLSKLEGKDLVWFDVYLGKKQDNRVRLAPVYVEKAQAYFLEDDGTRKKVAKVMNFDLTYTVDYDDGHFLAAQIEGSTTL